MYNSSAIGQYQSVDVQSKVAASNPHKLISMLLEGALKKIAIANGATKRGDLAQKGVSLSGAIRIIDSLRAALDLERGGEIADNLTALYSYMERRLLEANQKSDVAMMTEVSSLLTEIKSSWDQIS
ncbi:MAG: flagellar export chaperone FliS [Pseudomonadota bacterium]